MSKMVRYVCGCSVATEAGLSSVEVRPCEHHRRNGAVQQALEAYEQVQLRLRRAVAEAHEDVPPLLIEQEERRASGDRFP